MQLHTASTLRLAFCSFRISQVQRFIFFMNDSGIRYTGEKLLMLKNHLRENSLQSLKVYLFPADSVI